MPHRGSQRQLSAPRTLTPQLSLSDAGSTTMRSPLTQPDEGVSLPSMETCRTCHDRRRSPYSLHPHISQNPVHLIAYISHPMTLACAHKMTTQHRRISHIEGMQSHPLDSLSAPLHALPAALSNVAPKLAISMSIHSRIPFNHITEITSVRVPQVPFRSPAVPCPSSLTYLAHVDLRASERCALSSARFRGCIRCWLRQSDVGLVPVRIDVVSPPPRALVESFTVR